MTIRQDYSLWKRMIIFTEVVTEKNSFFSKNVTKGHGDETGFCGFVVKKSKNVDSELQLPELKLRWC